VVANLVLLAAAFLLQGPVMAATVTWTAPGDGQWEEPGNWSSGILPGPADDVLITGSPPPTVTHGSGSTAIHKLTLTGVLRISGGALTFTGTSLITGRLELQPGASLTAYGANASLTVTDAVSIDGGALFALAGGRLILPTQSHYDGNGTISAQGPGSRIELNELDTIGVRPPGLPDLVRAVSRSVSTFRGILDGDDPALDIARSLSRSVSIFRGTLNGDDPASDIPRALSRTVSIFRGTLNGDDPATDIGRTLSRAVSVLRTDLPADGATAGVKTVPQVTPLIAVPRNGGQAP